MRVRFEGEICGFGTASGYRVVIGRWPSSPLGPISDAMVEAPDGHRTLVAPSAGVADYIAGTYAFDAVAVGPVVARRRAHGLEVEGPGLEAAVAFGRRPPLGLVLRAVPRRIGAAPWFAALVDPLARVALPGVRTRGSAGGGRREWYGAHDLHVVTAVRAQWNGRALGALAPVDPPVRFGFGSTPRRPSVVAVTTTIDEAEPAPVPRRPAPGRVS